MRRRLPPLNSLRAFEALGRHGKLTAAADELCVTLGAVSRHISQLEEFVGAKLFERHRRGFSLTGEGERYLRVVTHAFDMLDGATGRFMGSLDQRRLSVRVYTTFASEWLVPRLTGFFDSHPEIDFRLSSAISTKDIDRDDIDIGIRRGPIAADMDGDALYFAEYYPVCSPSLLSRGPGLTVPQDLRRHTLLTTELQASNWRAWLDAAGVSDIEFDRALWFDSAALTFRAAREGVGVALGQRHYLTEDFIAGRLVAPFRHAIRSRSAFHMVFSRARANEPQILAFRDWVKAEMSKTEDRRKLIRDFPSGFVDVH
ncbi:transcriptional regulator GcvA [Achromobacter aloeverae]